MKDVLESLNYSLLDNIRADLPIWMIALTKRIAPTLSIPIEEQIATVEGIIKLSITLDV